MISLGPGQRETIKSGPQQDLWTPILQAITIGVCGAWALGWLIGMALAVGPALGYGVSFIALAIRWERERKQLTAPPWMWLTWNVICHTVAVWYLDIIWTPYNFGWSPWLTFLWSFLCAIMIVPAVILVRVMNVRIFDPNFPPTRQPVDRLTPIRPGTKEPGEIEIQVTPEREEIAVLIEDHVTTETAYPERQKCVLFSPVGHPGHLALYAAALVREDENTRAAFSFAGGKDHHGAAHWKYTRAEYGELSEEAERAGVVYREKENQPFEITDRGNLTFKRLAEKGLSSTSLLPRPEIT